MSGHNKWSKIRHKKAAVDAKRGKVFSKLAQQITIAARDGGGDPDSNPSLRLMLDKAREASMPAANVERAVKKGTGEDEGAGRMESATYEGFGPENVGIIIDALTDNGNRTVSELRQLFSENGGSLGESGSVSWNFNHQGLIAVRPATKQPSEKHGQPDIIVDADAEEVMLELMDIDGIIDIKKAADDDYDYPVLEVYCEPTMFGKVRDAVAETLYIMEDAMLVWVAKNPKDINSVNIERIGNFIDLIEENQDVVNVWTEFG